MSKMVLTGQDEIIRKLKRLARTMPLKLVPTVTKIGVLVERESMKRTLIKTGDLQGSHRIKVFKTGGVVGVTIFLTKVYALFVHEAKEGTKFRSPWPRGRKFLERAINENTEQIKVIIKKGLV